MTFRCPGLTGAAVGTGQHVLSVTVSLDDASSLTATATWAVLAATEP